MPYFTSSSTNLLTFKIRIKVLDHIHLIVQAGGVFLPVVRVEGVDTHEHRLLIAGVGSVSQPAGEVKKGRSVQEAVNTSYIPSLLPLRHPNHQRLLSRDEGYCACIRPG